MEIALINNNSLILGPMGFNVRMINSELEELEVEGTTTLQSYANLPIHFTENLTHFISLKKEVSPHDSKHHNVGNFFWEIVEENGVPIKGLLTYMITDKTLEEVKVEVSPYRIEK
jgi:hypothetical protein